LASYQPGATIIHLKPIRDGLLWVAGKLHIVSDTADSVGELVESCGRTCPNPDCHETGNDADALYCKKCATPLDNS